MAIYCLEHLDNKSFLELTRRDFRNFMIHAQDEWHLSAARCNRELSMIHMMLAYCEDDTDEYEDYDRNASEKIKGIPKEKVREIEFLDDADILTLVDRLMEKGDYKKATLVAVFYDTGSRKNEVAQFMKESFLDESKSLTNAVRGKRGKIYRAVYHSLTKKCVKKYLEQRGEDDVPNLFITEGGQPASAENLYDWIVSLRPMITEITGKDSNFFPHCFRHSYIQNLSTGEHYLCREGNLGKVSLDKIKLLVNHSDLSTTDSYRKDMSLEEIGELFGIDMNE